MNRALMFSSESDEWSTPQDIFDNLHNEFKFQVDLAASVDNRKCERWWAKDDDSLVQEWSTDGLTCGWLNPPYSRPLQSKFIAKAAHERKNGFLTVMLLPARTDTKAFHQYIYDSNEWLARPGVQIRFLPGRLKFGASINSAPFPSMIVVFQP